MVELYVYFSAQTVTVTAAASVSFDFVRGWVQVEGRGGPHNKPPHLTLTV